MSYSLVFKNCSVIDGSGAEAYTADVALKDNKIAEIGFIDGTVSADRVIDGTGLTLIPGIIDCHSHYDAVMLMPECKFDRVGQGITTEIVGYCGPSLAPFDPEKKDLLQSMYYSLTDTGYKFPWEWKTVDELFSAMEIRGMAENVASFIGHGTLRTLCMGHEKRTPTAKEMDRMKGILADSIDAGAMGLALGLSYVPGAFCDSDELQELAKVVEQKGGIIAAHRRDEGNNAVEAVDEVLDIAEKTGVKMHLCHIKVMGQKNWGKADLILNNIERVRNKGIDIKFDVYPYVTGCINLHYILPSWAQSGTRADMLARLNDEVICQKVIADAKNPEIMARSLYTYATPSGILISACSEKEYQYRMLSDIAKERNEDPVECAIGLIRRSEDSTSMIPYLQSEDELLKIIKHPCSMICSDGFPSCSGVQHPRYIGAFTHFLDYYAKENHFLKPEEAVRKITGLPAEHFGLKDRGLIRKGYYADMALIDWSKLKDRSTIKAPTAGAEGILMTVMNGRIVAENGVALKDCAGHVLKK